ncbi:MAG TPA: efflux RND transporter permease subunit, partial [Steroidobacteraceae bacterium]|nr:efflux RND transporter permease subunit [Steroidobacteraceae bacterium]
IFRHIELGESPEEAAEIGGREVALPVLASTLTTAIVFFPVTFLSGVSKFLFTALALSVVISLIASYFVAMMVVPLFCAKLIKATGHEAHGPPLPEGVSSPARSSTQAGGSATADGAAAEGAGAQEGGSAQESSAAVHARRGLTARFIAWFNHQFRRLLTGYDIALVRSFARPAATLSAILGVGLLLLGLFPAMGFSYFPRTDPGQFVINLKAPSGTEVYRTEDLVKRVENTIRQVVEPRDLGLIVSNIGSTPGFSSIYTSNSAPHTAFVQVGLTAGHHIGSYEYMDRVRARLKRDVPEVSTYFQSGGLVDAVLNQGLPTPIDIQVSAGTLNQAYQVASDIAAQVRGLPAVSDVLVPQDIDDPALQIKVNRTRAAELGLSQKEVVSNVITAATSNAMIAPSYWVDPASGNDYLLTVQYFERAIKNLNDLKSIPLRSKDGRQTTTLDAVADVKLVDAPSEVDHYQLRKVIDVYVATSGEDLSRVTSAVNKIVAHQALPEGVRVALHGSVKNMYSSFSSFGAGLILAIVLVYLILVAQFSSFVDPLLILLAVPTGLSGVVLTLWLTGTTLNVMSLMGIVMMVGIVVSNSILIVEFTRRLIMNGVPLEQALREASGARLRPILMTSLATILGLIPMALKLGEGSESYAPLARAIVGGLTVSVVTTVFIVPVAYLMVYRRLAPPPLREVPDEI